MRNLLKIIFILLITSGVSKAQQWVKVKPIFEPLGNYNTYRGVFVDENHGWWLAGFNYSNATVLHTTNGGVSWSKQTESIAEETIEFIDTLHGWILGSPLEASGDKDFILITKDGGKTWDKYFTPFLWGVTFFDSLNGFAGGDSIYSTTDGGITWKTQEVESGPRFGISAIFFSDGKHGWAAGLNGDVFDAGILLNTIDSGKTWQYVLPADLMATAIYFTDSLHGCIIGHNYPVSQAAIKTTKDGGKTWILRYPDSPWLNDVFFIDDKEGWIAGDLGFIWHTIDGGLNWTRVESGTTSDLQSIFFFNNGETGYILGEDSTFLKYEKTVGINERFSSENLSFNLFQNYPNPFNPSTTIKYEIPKSTDVSLKIFNALGQGITVLVNEIKRPGSYEVKFDASGLSSGVYIAVLKTTVAQLSRSMLLIK